MNVRRVDSCIFNPSAEEMRIGHFSELDFVLKSALLNIDCFHAAGE